MRRCITSEVNSQLSISFKERRWIWSKSPNLELMGTAGDPSKNLRADPLRSDRRSSSDLQYSPSHDWQKDLNQNPLNQLHRESQKTQQESPCKRGCWASYLGYTRGPRNVSSDYTGYKGNPSVWKESRKSTRSNGNGAPGKDKGNLS